MTDDELTRETMVIGKKYRRKGWTHEWVYLGLFGKWHRFQDLNGEISEGLERDLCWIEEVQ